jgi:hypothetical protein
MVQENNSSAEASDMPQEVVFAGEEDVGERSSPSKDLGTAVAISVFAIAATLLAFNMPVIQEAYTAPGILPIITGITLLGMAIGLGKRAMRMGGHIGFKKRFFAAINTFFANEEDLRTVFLFGLVGIYIVCLLNLSFSYDVLIFEFRRALGSFELYSIIFLTGILKFFWGENWMKCLGISTAWILILSSLFVHGFSIPMPGMA